MEVVKTPDGKARLLMQRTLLVIAMGLVLSAPITAWAIDRPPPPKLIKLKIRPIVGLGRSQAPQTFEISLESAADKIYEGRLELKWYLGKGLVHEFLSQEMAVNSAGQKFRLTLPPIILYSDKTNVTAYGRFLTERADIDLGEVPTDLPAMTKRTLVVAEVTPQEFQRARFGRGISDSVGLEQFNPYSDAPFDLLTYTARITPEEMPALATGYAGFDMVVVEGEGFRRLNRRQLTAIVDWIAGGGSIVVAPPDDNVAAAHVEFLNRLNGDSAAARGEAAAPPPRFATDEHGRLMPPAQFANGECHVVRRHFGLGRVALVLQPRDHKLDFTAVDWIETVLFLWKVRAAQRESVLQAGTWDLPPPTPRGVWAPSKFAWQRDDLARTIRQLLIPERIEGVPFSVVAVILSLFLLAVAPGDYFLLGRFNCRKYTWLLFVAISSTFTMCTVKIADFYMGHNDYHTSLTLVDLEGDGEDADQPARRARTSRFEMTFVATQQTVEHGLKNCLFLDVTDSADIQDVRQLSERPIGLSDEDKLDRNTQYDVDLPVYEGTMPAAFTVHQQLRQWSPRITRQTAFGAELSQVAETTIGWSALSSAALDSTEGRNALFQKILAAEPDAEVLLLNRRWAYSPTHNDGPRDRAAAERKASAAAGVSSSAPNQNISNVPATADASPAVQSASRAAALTVHASVRPASGIFALFSQIAPTGGQIFEDLALLDADDAGQWLVVVVIRRENDWFVFRRLLHGDPWPEGV